MLLVLADRVDALEHRVAKLVKILALVPAGAAAVVLGLTSGIDLALHVVELYFGRGAAARTAQYMEYQWSPPPSPARE